MMRIKKLFSEGFEMLVYYNSGDVAICDTYGSAKEVLSWDMQDVSRISFVKNWR